MKSPNSTLTSIGLGFGALVFAFLLIFSDPQQGGNVVQQIQKTAGEISSKVTSSNNTTLDPEGRIDGMMPYVPLPGKPVKQFSASPPANTQFKNNQLKSAEESYLDNAWGSPPPQQQAPVQQMRQRMATGPAHGFGGFQSSSPNVRPNFPMGQGQRGNLFQQFQQFRQGGQSNSEPDTRSMSARDAIASELSYARGQASQASACLSRAQNSEDREEKKSAADQARSCAQAALGAAARAASSAGGVPGVEGLVEQVRTVANDARASAEQATNAANAW